ncbi:DUF116 domain-containing protein [Peptacetobacter sp.]|uniref:DUF116 domain-containing protein n=1 Tax=Peptacetobacter sp. TaxID=2991975 RepID=UPI002ED5D3DF
MSDIKKYSISIAILFLILLFFTTLVDILIVGMPRIIITINILIFIIIASILLFSATITRFIICDKKVNKNLMKFNFMIAKTIYPIVVSISELLKMSKSSIRRIFIKLNNSYVKANKYNLTGEKILILLPHCLQFHNCKFRVTSTIDNCARCGLCNISDLAKLGEKENVHVFIATGGTLARKVIIETRPKAVIAVACERDLTEGIIDVKGIPVLGVYNERPNGPCFDTRVSVEKVKEAIDFFKGE